MKSAFFMLLCCTFLAFAQQPTTVATPDDATFLQGAWKITSAFLNGEQLEEQRLSGTFTFEKDTLLLQSNLQAKFIYKLDAQQTPKHIDITQIERRGKTLAKEKQEHVLGIYKIENGKLYMCYQDEPESQKGRPKGFTTSKDSETILFVCERMTSTTTNEPAPATNEPAPATNEPAPAVETPTKHADFSAIQGTWQAVLFESEKKELPQEIVSRIQFEIREDNIVIYGNYRDRDDTLTVAYTIDPSKSPKHFDISDGRPLLGIYELSGNELKLCFAESDDDTDRPKNFDTTTQSDTSLILLLIKFTRVDTSKSADK